MTDTPIDMGMVSAPLSNPSPAPPPPPAAPARSPQLRPSAPENPRSRGYSPAIDRREEVAARTAAPQDRPVADPAPVAASTEKHRIGEYEVTAAEIGELMADRAQRDLAAATRPPTPDAYELKLPEGMKLPGDQTFRFDATDPGLVAAKNWAHAKGLGQSDFSEMMGIYASHVASQEAMFATRAREELAKVGVNAPQRVDAVTRWITAEIGEADARPIRASLLTDAHLRFYERMMNKISSQGTAPFSQQHRVAPDQSAIPGYDKMTFEQRRQAQDQRNAGRQR